ncbi:unnamed protein product [Choristocarpus tenellus]
MGYASAPHACVTPVFSMGSSTATTVTPRTPFASDTEATAAPVAHGRPFSSGTTSTVSQEELISMLTGIPGRRLGGMMPPQMIPRGVLPTSIIPTGLTSRDMLPGGVLPGNMVSRGMVPGTILPGMTGLPMGYGSMGCIPPSFQDQSSGFGGNFGLHINPSGRVMKHDPFAVQSQQFFNGSIVSPPVSRQVPTPASQGIVGIAEANANEEVKEEKDDDMLRPTPEETPLVASLQNRGIPVQDAVQSLRLCGNQLQPALVHALQTLQVRRESYDVDMARLESEKEKEKILERERQEQAELTVHGDIVAKFQESFLLDRKEGCRVFRGAIVDLCTGQAAASPNMTTFREKAVQLLFLERDIMKWYRDVRPQVQGYFRKLIARLQALSPEAFKDPAHGEAGQGRANQQDQDIGSLAKGVEDEIKTLKDILFRMPTTAGGVPDAFLECSSHSATLDVDGVQELSHRSRPACRNQGKTQTVIALDDDGG